MRADVGVVEVAVLVTLHLKQPFEVADAIAEQMNARLTQLMLDGLRPGGASPLPGRPTTLADINWDIAH
jgi:hypothetical protein